MVLNLIALVVVPAAIMSGLLLMRRHLGAGSTKSDRIGGREIRCVACGTAAEQFTTLRCPNCGRDAREQGLWVEKQANEIRNFWRVVIFTYLIVPFELLILFILAVFADRESQFSSSRTLTPPAPRSFQSIELSASGSLRRYGPPVAGLIADLNLKDGNVVTLEVDSPAFDAVVTGADGNVITRGTLTEALVMSWLATAGSNLPEDEAKADGNYVSHAINQELRWNPISSSGGGGSGIFSSTGGGSSMWNGPPAWIVPATLMSASLVWLIGTHRILRGKPLRNQSITRASMGEGVDP